MLFIWFNSMALNEYVFIYICIYFEDAFIKGAYKNKVSIFLFLEVIKVSPIKK